MDVDEAPSAAPPAAAAVETTETTTPAVDDASSNAGESGEVQEPPAASNDDAVDGKDTNDDKPPATDDKESTKRRKTASAPRTEIPGERRSDRARQAPRALYTVAEETVVEEEFVVPEGPGTKLRDIDYLAEKVSKCGKRDVEVLKMLYSVMFSRRFSLGIMRDAKQHILDFSGYTPIDDEEDKEKFRDELAIKLCRGTLGFVDVLMDFLQIDRSKKSFVDAGAQGSKDDKVERIIDWLFLPTATEVKAKAKPVKKAAKKTKTSAKAAAKKPKKSADSDSTTDDEDDTSPKTAKKAASKKRKAADGESEAPKKKRVAAKKAKKAVADDAETESENEDVFEEAARKAEAGLEKTTTPSPKKQSLAKKKAAPTALPEDIQTRLKQIVTEGDVETLTLKTVMDTLTAELNADVKTHKKAIKDFIANCL